MNGTQNRYISEQQAGEENGLRRSLNGNKEYQVVTFCVCVLEFSPGHKAGCTGHLYQRFFIGDLYGGARLYVRNIIRHAAFKLQDDDLYTRQESQLDKSFNHQPQMGDK